MKFWVSSKFPELLHDLRGELGRDAAQIGQLLGEPLHVRLRQGAQNLLGQLLAHGHQQDRRLAHPGYVGRRRRRAAPFWLSCSAKTLVLSPAAFALASDLSAIHADHAHFDLAAFCYYSE